MPLLPAFAELCLYSLLCMCVITIPLPSSTLDEDTETGNHVPSFFLAISSHVQPFPIVILSASSNNRYLIIGVYMGNLFAH